MFFAFSTPPDRAQPTATPKTRPAAAAWAVVLAGALAATVGCGGSGKGSTAPGAQSPERQSDAEYDLARDDFYRGKTRSALDHAKRAVDLNDENVKALYFTSTIYLWFCSTELGLKSPDCRLPEAERLAKAALKFDDSFRDARNLLGQVLILEQRYPEAIQTLDPLTKDPSYTATHLAWGNLGWAQVLSGDVDGGIASLKNAVTQPKFCVGHYRLGMAYEKKGDLAQAEASLTNAVTVESPDCQNLQDAWEARAHIRAKLGKTADANADYEKCRDIAADSPTGKVCVQRLVGHQGKSLQ
jgi:type IV pilus assembly protein PilF